MNNSYNVIWVRDENGTRGQLNSTPMTHDEACTYMSKITNPSWRRLVLEEVVVKKLYQVYDRQTGLNYGKPCSLAAAIRKVDKLDNAYGGYRYGKKPVEVN